jgi:hypothetical protein
VVVAFGNHRVDEGDIVNAGGEVREERTDPMARLTVAAEFKWAFHHLSRLAEKAFVLSFAFESFAVEFCEVRLVIEGVDVAHATGAKDLDDATGAGREVREKIWCRFGASLAVEHPGESKAADATGCAPEKMSA